MVVRARQPHLDAHRARGRGAHRGSGRDRCHHVFRGMPALSQIAGRGDWRGALRLLRDDGAGGRAMSGAAMTWDDAELSAVSSIVEWLDADVGPRETVRRANDRGLARTRTIRLRASVSRGLEGWLLRSQVADRPSSVSRAQVRRAPAVPASSRAQAGAGAGAASLLSRRRADHARRAARAGGCRAGGDAGASRRCVLGEGRVDQTRARIWIGRAQTDRGHGRLCA